MIKVKNKWLIRLSEKKWLSKPSKWNQRKILEKNLKKN